MIAARTHCARKNLECRFAQIGIGARSSARKLSFVTFMSSQVDLSMTSQVYTGWEGKHANDLLVFGDLGNRCPLFAQSFTYIDRSVSLSIFAL